MCVLVCMSITIFGCTYMCVYACVHDVQSCLCPTQNDNPGPGAYNSGCDPLEAPSVSSSQRGTGGFASKVERA